MAEKDDISATEKLLDLIRKGQQLPQAPGGEPVTADPARHHEIKGEGATDRPLSFELDDASDRVLTIEIDDDGTAERTGPPDREKQSIDDELSLTLEHDPVPTEPLELEEDVPAERTSSDLSLEEEEEREQPKEETVRDAELVREHEENRGARITLPPVGAGKRYLTQWRVLFRRQKFLGIHIDPEHVDVVLVSKRGDTVTLLDFRSLDRPADTEEEDWQAAALAKAVDDLCHGRQRLPAMIALADSTRNLYHILPKLPEKQRANAIYWAIKKDQEFDDATTIFDYLTTAELTVKDQPRTLYAVCLADRGSIAEWRSVCERCNLELVGITTPHHALHVLLRQRLALLSDGLTAVLFIGDGHSVILVYHRQQLLFSRAIHSGLASLDEEGFERLATGTATTIEDAFSFARCDPGVLGRLLRQLQRTIDYCTSNYETPPAERIYIGGLPAADPAFIAHCTTEIQAECHPFDPFTLGLVDAEPLTGEGNADLLHRRQRLTAALGAATSDPHRDQNFLFTYQDKEARRRSRTVSTGIVLGFSALLGILMVGNWFLDRQNQRLQAELLPLEKEIASTLQILGGQDPQVLLINKIEEIKRQRQAVERYTARHLPEALFGEIAAALPPPARLTSVEYRWLPPVKDKPARHTITMGTILSVSGPTREVALATLLQKLSSSPLITGRPRVQTKKAITSEAGDGLFVILEFTVEDPFGAEQAPQG